MTLSVSKSQGRFVSLATSRSFLLVIFFVCSSLFFVAYEDRIVTALTKSSSNHTTGDVFDNYNNHDFDELAHHDSSHSVIVENGLYNVSWPDFEDPDEFQQILQRMASLNCNEVLHKHIIKAYGIVWTIDTHTILSIIEDGGVYAQTANPAIPAYPALQDTVHFNLLSCGNWSAQRGCTSPTSLYWMVYDNQDFSNIPAKGCSSDFLNYTDLFTKVSVSEEHYNTPNIIPEEESLRQPTLELYNRFKSKIIPAVRPRHAAFTTRERTPEDALIGSISFGIVDKQMSRGRNLVYEALKTLKPEISDRIHLHIISGGKQLYTTPMVEQFNATAQHGASLGYYSFLRHSYFLLNFVGLHGSAPLRIFDACATDTAVISDKIYVEGLKDFPAYFISADTRKGFANVTAIQEEITHLVENFDTIYNDLIEKQRRWCNQRLSLAAHAHYYMFRHIPDQPLADNLLCVNPRAYQLVYGAHARNATRTVPKTSFAHAKP